MLRPLLCILMLSFMIACCWSGRAGKWTEGFKDAAAQCDPSTVCSAYIYSVNDWKSRLENQVAQTNTCQQNVMGLNASLKERESDCQNRIASLTAQYEDQFKTLKKEVAELGDSYRTQISIFNKKYNNFVNSLNESAQTTQQGQQSLAQVGNQAQMVQ